MTSFERHRLAARSRLGSYELIRPLARGGMAELFLVRSVGPEGFEKTVVLKRVLPHFAENQKFVRAFLEEAKLVAGLEHPNIAPVYDMGRVDGSYYFTMEYVRGVDVRAILKRCKRAAAHLPIEHAVIIARDIASALHYAHERRGADGNELSLVHRDVSPSNIIVSFEGAPKLIDFGIAKATSSSAKTQTGTLKGKVSYMSPEQARGAAIDRRTDVFALGIVLWEMLAGKRLFKGDNDLATLQRIIYEPAPSLGDARPDCPEALVRIVGRALSLDAAARYPSAQELQLELEDFAHEHKLKLSTFALGMYLREQFADQLRDAADDLAGGTMTDVTAAAPDADPEDDPDELEAFDRSTVAGRPIPAVTVGAAPVQAAPLRRRVRWPWVVSGLSAIAVAIGMASLDRAPAAPTTVVDRPPAEPVEPAPSPSIAVHAAAGDPRPPVAPPEVTRPSVDRVGDPAGEHPITHTNVSSRPKSLHKIVKQPTTVPVPSTTAAKEAATPELPAKKPSAPFDPNAVFPP